MSLICGDCGLRFALSLAARCDDRCPECGREVEQFKPWRTIGVRQGDTIEADREAEAR